MARKLLCTVFLLTFASIVTGAQYQLTNAAPNAELPRYALQLPVMTAVYVRDAALASEAFAGHVITGNIVGAHAVLPTGTDWQEPNPAHITLVIDCRDRTASPELMGALTELRMTGRVSAVDAEITPGRIFVLGEQDAVLALRSLPGVNAIARLDAPLAQDVWTASDASTSTMSDLRNGNGSIMGFVTAGGSSTPLGDIGIFAYSADGSGYGDTTTDSSGIYRIGGLPAGNYKLYLFDAMGIYAMGWYSDKTAGSSADLIAVTDDTTATANIPLALAGVIEGAVTAENSGTPLSNVSVTIYNAISGNPIAHRTTDSSGTFRAPGLGAGNYKLRFYDNSGNHLAEYGNNKPDLSSADSVNVTAGITATIHVQLAQAGTIMGTVTAEVGGASLANINVTAYDAVTGESKGYALTDSSGFYRIDGLNPGGYKLQFYDYMGAYTAEYYNNKSDLLNADTINVIANSVSVANIQLARNGAIGGTVTVEGSGALLDNVRVTVYDATTGNDINSATSIVGVFAINRLPAGNYKVRFYDQNGIYVTEYHNDEPDLFSADLVGVTSGATTTVNAILSTGGTFTGRVTDLYTGKGIQGVSVLAKGRGIEGSYRSATTDANGYYTNTGLAIGVYQVSFCPPQPYWSEYYDNQQYAGPAPTLITVTAHLTTTDVNAALRTGYIISGQVTSSEPLTNVVVHAYRGADSNHARMTWADGNGTYQLGPLVPGDYRVYFQSGDGHASEWYNDSTTYAGATVIRLTDDISHIDAELGEGGRIAGTVTSASGAPLPYTWVYIYSAGSSAVVASAWTDTGGYYTLTTGLAPGLYQVYFYAPSGYVSEWYDDKPAQAIATLVTVASGVTLTVNARLSPTAGYTGPTGAITGSITAADTGLPLPTWVDALTASGTRFKSVYAFNGTYALSGLPPGAYRLYFYVSSPYLPRYYSHKFSLWYGNWVMATAGMTTTNINQAIPRRGVITGRVSGSGGLPGVSVTAGHVSGNGLSRFIYTNVDGSYRLEDLEPGDYRLQFNAPAPFIVAPITVSVAPGAITPNANPLVTTGSIITGSVTAADTGAPLFGVAVQVNSADFSYFAFTDMEGRYRTPGLSSGDYRILFNAGSWTRYTAEWYNNALTLTVPVMGTVPNINATLDRGGSINGWTYNALTGLPLSSVDINVYSPTASYYAYSNNWGFYTADGLPTGSYEVQFSRDGYRTQWYNNTSDVASATTVVVSAPGEAANVNANMRYPYEVYLPLVLRD